MSDDSNEMMEDVGLPRGATPDPEQSRLVQLGRFPARFSFAAATGRLLFKPDGPGRGICRMFPTEDHMNMGGSLHGGAVMSFIDMSMFAGGLLRGHGAGHYVTLDLTTHFLARGQAGSPLDCPCRTGEADARPRLPAGRGQAERRALLQLQRHAQEGEPAQRTFVAMSGPVRVAYDALIAANELKPDPAQQRAVAALDRLARQRRHERVSSPACSARRATVRPASTCGAASGAASRC